MESVCNERNGLPRGTCAEYRLQKDGPAIAVASTETQSSKLRKMLLHHPAESSGQVFQLRDIGAMTVLMMKRA